MDRSRSEFPIIDLQFVFFFVYFVFFEVNYFFAVARLVTRVPISSPRTARSMLPSTR
jgi:hypothetical protein